MATVTAAPPPPPAALTEDFEDFSSISASDGVDITSNHVYIRHDRFGWIPARVLESNTETQTALVSIPSYKEEQSIVSDGGRTAKRFEKQELSLKGYPNGALPLQNVDSQGRLQEVQDMVDLPFLHEVS